MCLAMCRFVLVFFSPFGVSVASPREGGGGEGSGLGAFRAFGRFVPVWVVGFLFLLVSGGGGWRGGGGGVGLRFVVVALPGLFSCLFFHMDPMKNENVLHDHLYMTKVCAHS